MTAMLPPVARIGVLIAAALGCSESGTPSNVLSVGGTYPTVVALVAGQNTCTGVTVENNATTVDHSPGASAIGLTHAGTRYDGQVQTNGQFAAGPKTLVVGQTTYVIAMTGQFAIRGFTADIVVQASPAGGTPCGYRVSWTGTKQGADNVIP